MKILFTKSLPKIIASVLFCTVFSVSIPTHQAKAGGLTGGATLGMQITQQAELATSAIQNTLSATGITSLVAKEQLDGIAWAVAKQMVSQMTASLVNWINSGFEGSPAFITDLNSFLLDALDTAAGEYIKSLGGIGEFICSPFKLDIQASLEVSYAQARSGLPSGPTAPACKLSDIRNNVEGFLEGIGNWGEWLQVTSNPQNTPYGAYLEAEARLNIKLRNEAGQEKEILSWGEGFLSKKVCEAVEGTAARNTSGETVLSGSQYGQTAGAQPAAGGRASGNCTITTPGNVIAEQFNFTLTGGQRSLIEADEINEIIGALLNQLTLKAMEGINGLLGLSAGTGYTDTTLSSSSQPYIDALEDEAIIINTTAFKTQMDESLATENRYLALASSTLARASERLELVSEGQDAIDDIFNGGDAIDNLLKINKNNTLIEARARLNNLKNRDDGPTESRLVFAEEKLDALTRSLEVIESMNDSQTGGTNLESLSFTTLEAEGGRVERSLQSLVDEMGPIVTQTLENRTKLIRIISQYDNATTTGTGTSTVTAASKRQDIVIEFVELLNSGDLTPTATVEMNRVRWNAKLRI